MLTPTKTKLTLDLKSKTVWKYIRPEADLDPLLYSFDIAKICIRRYLRFFDDLNYKWTQKFDTKTLRNLLNILDFNIQFIVENLSRNVNIFHFNCRLKGMIRRNIEHFLRKLMYEKLGISEIFNGLYFCFLKKYEPSSLNFIFDWYMYGVANWRMFWKLNAMSDLYSNEESDYSEENTSEDEDFCCTILKSFQFEPERKINMC